MKRQAKSESRGFKTAAVLAGAALILLAASCSISSSGSAGVPSYGKGVVTAKGSIFVNGIEYDTSSAKITVNDSIGTDSDLKVGMIVEVKGSADAASGKGSASEILYSADVDGPIGSIDLATSSFTVFSRKVVVDSSTVWDGTTGLAALVPGDRVEVSGFVNTSLGALKADRVSKKVGSIEDYETKGVISALSSSSFTLTPPDGGAPLTVNFTGILAAGIVNGSAVELRFSSIAGSTVTTTADKIRLESKISPEDKSKGELGGLVADFAAGNPATFTVGGIPVSAASSLLPPGFGNGVEVEVKGTMSAGVLVADSVRSESEPNAELAGLVSDLSAPLGTVTVNGLVVTLDATTILKDEDDSGGKVPVARFNLASLKVGDYVEVSGLYGASSAPVFSATKLVRESPKASAMLKGPASAASASSLTILGRNVDISAATFKDKNGASVASGAAFSALLTLNATSVVAKGSYAAGTLTAVTVAIDD